MKRKKIDWEKMALTDEEKQVDEDLCAGVYKPVSRAEFLKIKEAIDQYNKSSVLNMRVNPDDILLIKEKAKKLGVKYQTFIAQILHRVARS
jgi:predicted DNA binding CopG/RHH family protein